MPRSLLWKRIGDTMGMEVKVTDNKDEILAMFEVEAYKAMEEIGTKVEKYAKALNIETEELLVISHVKPIYQMKEEIINCIKTASNEQTILAYKIFNGIFK